MKERIYIGGLNPPRLSAKDIFRRLKSLNQIEIESASIIDNGKDDESSSDESISQKDNKPYLHITAVSKHDSDSALSIISKQYHNVKWKGCKLVVEKAKPHFLERLEEERRQLRAKATEEEEEFTKEATETQKSDPSEEKESRIPRRLRVRKKFGDTAFHVDTKPWTVESWSRFHKARSKLQQREEKHRTSVIDHTKNSKDEQFTQPGPLMHRAVHIRFVADDTGLNGTTGSDGNENDETGTVISTSESSDSSSSDSGSDSESLKQDSQKENQSERYAWSDDHSDSDSDDSVRDNTSIPDDNSQSTTEMLMSRKQKEAANNAEAKQDDERKYQWSTDEESSDDDDDDDDDKNNNKKSLAFSRNEKRLDNVQCCGTDEFAAGFDDTSSFDKDDAEDPLFDGNYHTRSDNFESDLTGDVATNLNILSSIFPDMVDAKPLDPDDANSVSLNKENASSTSGNKRNNNSAYGIMPRYDPTAKSSSQFVVEEELNEKNDGNDSESSSVSGQNDRNDAMDEEKVSSSPEKEGKDEPVEGIYEQEELENVFRDARDAWGTEESSKTAANSTPGTTGNTDTSSGKGAFSFGFNLDDQDAKPKEQSFSADNSSSKAFSFSFSIPDQKEAALNDEEKTSSTTQRTEERGDDNSAPRVRERDADGDIDMILTNDDGAPPHRGLTLPDEDLQKYVDNFFACNDGVRIMQDPEGFRNDERERSEWIKERQTLTLDWKRKRKYAITRIQKRMKTGRR